MFSHLAGLTSLQTLNLAGNYLYGTALNGLLHVLTSLTSLLHLDLGGIGLNYRKDPPPLASALRTLTGVQRLGLSSCSMLVADLDTVHTSIRQLDVSDIHNADKFDDDNVDELGRALDNLTSLQVP